MPMVGNSDAVAAAGLLFVLNEIGIACSMYFSG